jgi:hypothetical protein
MSAQARPSPDPSRPSPRREPHHQEAALAIWRSPLPDRRRPAADAARERAVPALDAMVMFVRRLLFHHFFSPRNVSRFFRGETSMSFGPMPGTSILSTNASSVSDRSRLGSRSPMAGSSPSRCEHSIHLSLQVGDLRPWLHARSTSVICVCVHGFTLRTLTSSWPGTVGDPSYTIAGMAGARTRTHARRPVALRNAITWRGAGAPLGQEFRSPWTNTSDRPGGNTLRACPLPPPSPTR